MIASNMPKLHSPYIRDRVDGHYIVTSEIDTDFLWVFEDPEVYAMEKLDGTNVSVVIQDGNLIQVWNRRNLVSDLVNTTGQYEWVNMKDFNHVI